MKCTHIFILFIALMLGGFVVSSCSSQTNAQDSDHKQSSQEATNSEGNTMFWNKLFLDSRFRKALNEAIEDEYVTDKDEANKACTMLYDFLSKNNDDYDRVLFSAKAVSPYYFFNVLFEREIQPTFVVNVNQGVITPDLRDAAVKQFIKDIKLMETNEFDAYQLAKMISAFYIGSTDRLVTVYDEKRAWRAEMNTPELKKNENGSIALLFDLQRDGRSVTVKQCTFTVTPDYDFKFDCQEKLH